METASPPRPASSRPSAGPTADLFGLEEAPTFYPTDEEFEDPYAYIESIRTVGESAGICKIVPPASWKPPFAVDPEHFKFQSRLQKLNALDANAKVQNTYLDGLQSFWENQGQPLSRLPQLDRRPVNLFMLKKEVEKRGGLSHVTERKLWADIGRSMGFSRETCTSLSHSLKSFYTKWVQPYDLYVVNNKSVLSPGPKRATAPAVPAAAAPKAAPKGGRYGGGSKAVVATGPPAVEPAAAAAATSPDAVEGAPTEPASAEAVVAPEQLCEVCSSGDFADRMLLCDGCDLGYHMECLAPPVLSVPKGKWLCPKCLTAPEPDFGFEEGRLHTLKSFKEMADRFKLDWFKKFSDDKGTVAAIAEDDVEREFWRLVASPFEHVEVEYGADVHSSKHGSGFPSFERQPNKTYTTCPWNLNNLPVLQDSVLSHIQTRSRWRPPCSDISGMMVPWLYVGMCFSAFCWHNEDHYTYSINYLHWGDTKTWYGVPGSDAEAFERTMRETAPELFDAQPDLLFQLVTMLSPMKLKENGVKVTKAHQRAGEFVITFPQAYHAGFNQGYNCAEAVNFATLDWIEFGFKCVQRYREFHKSPCFSHDELLFNIARTDKSINTAIWLKEAVVRMHDEEITSRQRLQAFGAETEDLGDREENTCSVCNSLCFLSVVSTNNGRTEYCVQHALELAKQKHVRDLTLRVRVSQDDLRRLVDDVRRRADRPQEWRRRLRELLRHTRKPSLKAMQLLLQDADRIPVPIPEADGLRAVVEQGAAWADKITRILARRQRKRAPARGERENAPATAAAGAVAPGSDSGKARLSDVEALLAEADSIPFDVPEVAELRLVVKGVANFRDRARRVLERADRRTLTIDELNEVLHQGRSLEVEVDEVVQLHRLLQQTSWADKVNRFGTDRVDIANVEALLQEAEKEGIGADHPDVIELRRQHAAGEQWNAQASLLLAEPRRHPISEWRDVAEQGQDLVVRRALLGQITKAVSSTEAWTEAATRFINDVALTSKAYAAALAPPAEPSTSPGEVDVAERADTELSDEAVDPASADTAEPASTAAVDAGNLTLAAGPTDPAVTGATVDTEAAPLDVTAVEPPPPNVAVTDASAPSATPVGKAVVDGRRTYQDLKALFDEGSALPIVCADELSQLRTLSEDMQGWLVRGRLLFQRKGAGALHESLAEVLAHTERVLAMGTVTSDHPDYCICRQPDGGFMISCDKCDEWFHGRCLSVSKKESQDQASFVCPLCDWTKPVPHATRRSALIDLVLWDRDSTLLKMAAQPELRLLHELLTKLGEWQTAVRAVLAKPGFVGDAEAVAQRLLRQGLMLEVAMPEVELLKAWLVDARRQEWCKRARAVLLKPIADHAREYKDVLKESADYGDVAELVAALRTAVRTHKRQLWNEQTAVLLADPNATEAALLEHVHRGEALKVAVQELDPVRHRIIRIKVTAQLEREAAERAARVAAASRPLGAATESASATPLDDQTVSTLLLSLVSPEQLSPPAAPPATAGAPTASVALPTGEPSTATPIVKKRKSAAASNGDSVGGAGKRQRKSIGSTVTVDADASPTTTKTVVKRKKKADAEPVYCLCRSTASDVPMIACDSCDDWFHFVCVNVPEETGDDLAKYTCPNCCAAAGRPYPFGPLPTDAGFGRIIVKSPPSASPIISVVGTPMNAGSRTSPAPPSPAISAMDLSDGAKLSASPPTPTSTAAPQQESGAAAAVPVPLPTLASVLALAAPKKTRSVIPMPPRVGVGGAIRTDKKPATKGSRSSSGSAKARKPGSGDRSSPASAPPVVDVVMPSPDRRDWLPAPDPAPAAAVRPPAVVPGTFSAYAASIRPTYFPPLGSLHAVAPLHPYGMHPNTFRPPSQGSMGRSSSESGSTVGSAGESQRTSGTTTETE